MVFFEISRFLLLINEGSYMVNCHHFCTDGHISCLSTAH